MTSRPTRKNHERADHTNHAITCTICSEGFPNSVTLQVHLLAKHCSHSDNILEHLKKQETMMIAMQAQITALTTRVSSAPQPSLTVPPAPLPVSAPAPLPPLLPARPPAPAYSSVARRAPAQVQPQIPTGPIKKISYVTDSIGGNVMLPELEQLTKAKINTRKAYGAMRAPDHFYPDANFTDIVPKDKDDDIESVWAVFTPKVLDQQLNRIKRVCVGSVYIAPRSTMKQGTMDHIIQTIHLIRA